MVSKRVLIYQPQDVDKYAKSREGIEQFLRHVTSTRIPELQSQFRWFGYLRPSKGDTWNYAGLMYIRDISDKLDPLAQVDGITMVEGFNKLAKHIGARVLSADYKEGRMEAAVHIMEDYGRILGWALVPNHREYNLNPPQEVNLFILNLVPDAKDKIIVPFLESNGYERRFQFITLPDEPQITLIREPE